MKRGLKLIRGTMMILMAVTFLFGCDSPVSFDNQPQGSPPAGLAQAYDDAGWKLLSDVEGTLSYEIQAGQVPDIKVGDQVIRPGNELREVVAIVNKTDTALVVHTTVGNIARLFPKDSTLSVNTDTMMATVEYPNAQTRGGSDSYTLPVVLNKVRQLNEDGTETILFYNNGGRSIDLINVQNSTSIIDIDKTFTHTIFNVTGSGEKEIGKKGKVEYSGDASLTIEERLRLGVDFNIRLYLNYDCGINWVQRSSEVRWYFFGWHSTTIVWYEPVAWDAVRKDLRASVSGVAMCSANATLSCNGEVTASYEVPLPIDLRYNFVIGVVPVEIGYSAAFKTEAKLKGSLNASTGASFGLNCELGAACDNSGWKAINTFSTSSEFTPPSLSASASISIVPKLANEIRLGIGFANTGVYGTITISPYLALSAQAGLLASERTWNVSCGVTGDVGVKASVVGYDLGSYNVQVLDYSKKIAGGTY